MSPGKDLFYGVDAYPMLILLSLRWFKEISSRASWQAVKDGNIKSIY